MTGLRAITRGSSFLKALPTAGHRIAGSNTLLWVLGCLLMDFFSEEAASLHRQMFDDGAKRKSREEGKTAYDQDDAGQEPDEQPAMGGESAGRRWHDFL